MWSTIVVLHFVLVSTFLELKVEGKTYYFNINKTSNEYMIRNRLNGNNSAHNDQYPSRIHISELRNNVTPRISKNEDYIHSLLDPEWDYNWKNITRHKLPPFIYNFYETNDITSPIRIIFNAKPQNSTIIRFNISEFITNNNTTTEVELHFYHTVEKTMLQKSLILRLYQLENDYFNETSLINPDSHKLLNVIYIYQAESGWQIFKLTNALHKWLQEKHDLLLFITISKPNEEQFSLFKDINQETFRTFLILKTEPEEKSLESSESILESGSCRKHDLYIDFAKLNWMKFIIAPPGFYASNCYGTCFRNGNVPNHVKVTSYIPEMARRQLCCAPVKYSSLPIMFYDKHGNVAIKLYEQMIISACGCR